MSYTRIVSDWLASIPSDPWPVFLPLVGTILVAVLYWRGARYGGRTGIGRRITALHAVSFYAGLILLLLAVASPLDTLSDEGLAAHMVQHEIIVLIAPPLLLLGMPIWPLWRALPVNWRRSSLRWLMRRHWVLQVMEGIGRVLGNAPASWCLFIGVFLVWHIPVLYDAALENGAVHAFEHATFLLTALVFWAHVVPSFPIQPKLSYLRRAGYVFAAAVVLHLQSIYIAVAVQPIYPFYGAGSDVIANQTAGGAIMDVSGEIVFTIAILMCVWLWLRDDERTARLRAEGVPPEPEASMSARGALLIAEADFAETDSQAP